VCGRRRSRRASGERAQFVGWRVIEQHEEETVSKPKLLAAVAAALLMAGPAAAVTVKNASKAEVTIGVDYGSKEKVETIAAGKSVTFECKEGCGVTGPWGFSWKASGDDEIVTDGTSLVTVMDGKKPE
jgi:hypothetical protein